MNKKIINKLSISLSIIVLTFLIAVMSGITANAVTACPIPFEYEQPNSEIITITKRGDEYLNWEEDSEGYLLVKENEIYYYAIWTENGPEATTVIASDSNTAHPGSLGSNIPNSLLEESVSKAETYRGTATFSSVINPNPQRKLLVIYVTYNDDVQVGANFQYKMTDQDIENKMFYGSNSVNNFYKTMLKTDNDVITPATGTGITTPGIIRVNLSGDHPNPMGNFEKMDLMMSAAINKAVAEGMDFSQFIDDGSNTLKPSMLSIAVIFQGYEASYTVDSPSVWASAGYNGTYGGTYIERMFLQGSVHANHFLSIGIIAHELGHSGYDFDDTYDYGDFNDGVSGGHGVWSLMSMGSWGWKEGDVYEGETPSYADAYNLVKSGLVIPEVIDYDEAVTRTISDHTEIYKIRPKTLGSQYFLLQQRINEGYDRSVFNMISETSSSSVGGLMIYHVDESVPLIRINDKNTHYKVAIEEAHGGIPNLSQTYSVGDFEDLFGNGKNEFSLFSNPSSALYSTFTYEVNPPTQLIDSGISITNIDYSLANRQTTFSVNPELNKKSVNLTPDSSVANTGYGIWFKDGEFKPNLLSYEQNSNNMINISESGTYYYAYGTQWNVSDSAIAMKVEVSADNIITATPGHISKIWWPVELVSFVADTNYFSRVSGSYPNFTVSLSEEESTQDDYGNTIQTSYIFGMNNVFGVTTLQGSLERANDIDMFAFKPLQYTGGFYKIYSSDISTDVQVELYDQNGTMIASDNDSGDGLNFEINYNIDPPQTYYIKISHSSQDGTGTYKLNLIYDDCGNTMETARTISVGEQSSTFFINYLYDTDYFKITAETTGIHTFYGVGENDCSYDLFDSSGALLESTFTVYPYNGSPYHYLKYNFIEGETYYVKVSSLYNDISASYRFNVYDYDY